MASLGNWKYTKNFEGDAYYIDNNQSAGTTGTLYLDGVKIGDAAQTVLYLGLDYKLSSKLSLDLDMMSYDDLHGRFGPLDNEFNSANNRGSIKLPSFGTTDLGATYQFSFLGYETRARLNVNNLFDKEYISQSQTNFHNEGGRTWNGVNVENNVYFGKGTTWNLSLNLRF
jgi:outer membrane receptor protein involved in Fe transport